MTEKVEDRGWRIEDGEPKRVEDGGWRIALRIPIRTSTSTSDEHGHCVEFTGCDLKPWNC
jgi:hypothetical protein